MKNLLSSLLIFSMVSLPGLFTACDKQEKETVPQVSPFKNEATLKQFDGLLASSLNRATERSQGTMSGNDFVATIQESFQTFLEANPSIRFAEADENRIKPYMEAWSTSITNALEKLDAENTTMEQALEFLRKQTHLYCESMADVKDLTNIERQAIFEQLTIKTSIMVSSIATLMPEQGVVGGRVQWGWFNRKWKCIWATTKAVGFCGTYIVLLVKSAGTVAVVPPGQWLARACLFALYDVLSNC